MTMMLNHFQTYEQQALLTPDIATEEQWIRLNAIRWYGFIGVAIRMEDGRRREGIRRVRNRIREERRTGQLILISRQWTLERNGII
jgi:hypothetical protein